MKVCNKCNIKHLEFYYNSKDTKDLLSTCFSSCISDNLSKSNKYNGE